MKETTPLSETAASAVEKLAFNAKETCFTLGISKVSLWRLERRGLLKPCNHLRHKIYARAEIERFLKG